MLEKQASARQAYLYDLDNFNKPIELTQLFLIGSSDMCNLKLKGASVQERQARIEFKNPLFLIRDLRTGSPTYVNNTQVQEAVLQEGDEIKVGDLTLIFSYEKKDQEANFSLSSKNPEWNEQLNLLGNVAKTNFPVLILGPSGTGKEIIAEAIHENSTRINGPLVKVNCSALTETLVESELFGHIKGSFTGAICDRKGAFETARGGTLFLDEIGDLPYGLQAKLLRALENNEIRPVGSDRTIATDVRIISATHQDLNAKINNKTFRSDLYYRLNVITVNPPCLIKRIEDFETLLYCFAKKMKVRFSFNAIQELKKHKWPGNIRELKNTVARAAAFFPYRQIEEPHIEKILDTRPHSIEFDENCDFVNSTKEMDSELPVIKEIEKQMILKRLAANRGNQRRTASDLTMPKSTLHDRLKTYNIDPKQFSRLKKTNNVLVACGK